MRESSNRLAETETADLDKAPAVEEAESETKFAGGKPPPVGDKFDDAGGTSALAYEEDGNERELKQKVGKLVDTKFGGNMKAAFEHYDRDKDGTVTKDELVKLLSDAGVGNGLTRGVWASKIIDKLDANADSAIAWTEFETVFRAQA